MNKKSSVVALGRPLIEERADIVQNNGFTEGQWIWLQGQARKKGVSAMFYARYIVQWFKDEVEASQQGSVAAKESVEKFDSLISSAKSKTKVHKSS